MFFSSHGVLGINARNLKYLKSSRQTRRILDSKLLTKKVLREAGFPLLDTIAVIKTKKELTDFNWESLPRAFALKPNRGFGGAGISVVYGKKKDTIEPTWIRGDGSLMEKKEIESHALDILDGNFSLFSLPDVVFFEERAKIISELKPYSWKGIPDIRIVVYEGVPVMAMLRLPTKESKGKANLHQGAIGVGIDLATGATTSAILHEKFTDYYPGTRYLLRGIKIPHFKKVLELAVSSQEVVGMKFSGVDVTIDREKGPVILELNVRPGLAVQMANLAGLEGRLKRIKGLKIESKEKGIRIAQDLFGGIEEDMGEGVLGKKVLGFVEEVELIYNSDFGEKKYKALAKIDTGAWRTSISLEIAEKLGIKEEGLEKRNFESALGEEFRPIAPLNLYIGGEIIPTDVSLADRSKLKYQMIIGRRDLKKFVIDPFKKNK